MTAVLSEGANSRSLVGPMTSNNVTRLPSAAVTTSWGRDVDPPMIRDIVLSIS